MEDSEMVDCRNENLCKICSKEKSKYACPRCGVLYCSLPCYQSEAHVNCSEAFYRDCVMQEIAARDADPAAERKMNDILKRFHENEDSDVDLDSDDDDSVPDLQERLQNVNLDDADSVWEKLTSAERKEFEDLLQSGDASDLVMPWQPWWLYRKQKVLVQDLNSQETEFNYSARCPPIKNNIPPFSQISKSAPSPSVKYNVMNVLAAYCYTVRFYNGEHHSMPLEASSVLINLSANLGLNHTYDSAVIAVEAVAHEAVNNPGFGGSSESITCMKNDVECILAGPEEQNCQFYLQSSLSDIHKLLSEAKTTDGKEKKKKGEFITRYSESSGSEVVQRDKLKLCVKKIEYYLSWSQQYFRDICVQKLSV